MDNLPEKCALRCVPYRIEIHEGMILFISESGFWGLKDKIMFERCEGIWVMRIDSTMSDRMVPVGHVLDAYNLVKQVYGDNFEVKKELC